MWKYCWQIDRRILRVKNAITSFPRAECLPDEELHNITELDLNKLERWEHALTEDVLPNVKKIRGPKLIEFCRLAGPGIMKHLEEIDLPNCTKIGEAAFMNCKKLKYVNLPCCNEIGQGAFINCCKLERIVLTTKDPILLGDFIFLNCENLDFKDKSKLKLSSKNENLRARLLYEYRNGRPERVNAGDDKFDGKNDVVEDQGAEYQPPYIFKNISENEKLFPHGNMPNASDIHQGAVGDCWLLAALSSLAASDPQAIKDCFIEDEQDRSLITVRLRKVKRLNDRYVACGPMDIQLNKSEAKTNDPYLTSAFYDNNALWVRLLEKAFAVYLRDHGFKKSENAKYQMRKDLHGALNPDAVITAITKRPAKLKQISKQTSEQTAEQTTEPINEQQIMATFNSIKKAVEKHQAITAASHRSLRVSGLPQTHAYSVLGIIERTEPTTVHDTDNQQEGRKKIENFLKSKNISLKSNNKYIILRNPHAGKGVFLEKGAEKGRIIYGADGICIIENSSFCELFPNINYTARKFISKKFNT